VIEEILELLKITEDYVLDKNKTIELASEEISAPILAVHNKITQAIMPKSMIPNPE